jgi:hypothetical protein
MKTKTSFVTNSSSSSFIVAFNNVPQSVEEMKNLLFPYESEYLNPYVFDSDDPKSWPVEQVAETVFNDLGQELNDEEFIEELQSGSCDLIPSRPYAYDNSEKDWGKIRERYEKEAKEDEDFAKEIVRQYRLRFPDSKFYRFEYSDNDGRYSSALEHGNLFENLDPVIYISKH